MNLHSAEKHLFAEILQNDINTGKMLSLTLNYMSEINGIRYRPQLTR